MADSKQLTRLSQLVHRFVGLALWPAEAHAGPRMEGRCAIASLILVDVLDRLGTEAVFVVGHHRGRDCDSSAHCWVETGGLIVDPTASQFGASSVRVLTVARNRSYKAWSRGTDALTVVSSWGGQAPNRAYRAYEKTVDTVLEVFRTGNSGVKQKCALLTLAYRGRSLASYARAKSDRSSVDHARSDAANGTSWSLDHE